MKKVILAIVLFVTTLSQAQESLFTNIAENQVYGCYSVAERSDGSFKPKEKYRDFKFEKVKFATGAREVYQVKFICEGEAVKEMDVRNKDTYPTVGYPYESIFSDKIDFSRYYFVSIGNYIYEIKGLNTNTFEFTKLVSVYIKEGKKAKKKKKKKRGFMSMLKEVKGKIARDVGVFSPEAKEFSRKKDLRKEIKDYLLAMKAKQESRTVAQKKSDKKIADFKTKYWADFKAKDDASWAEAKRYNDSVANTPEGKKYWAFIKARQGAKNGSVEIKNGGSSDIYIYVEGTTQARIIRSGFSERVNCKANYTYSYNSMGGKTRCYTANSACGSSVTVR